MSRRPLVVAAAVAAGVVAVDQATKSWAVSALADRTIELFWTVRLRLAFNTGVAFSIGRGRSPVLAVVGIGLLVTLVFVGRALRTPATAVSFGLILGGACGNITDRLLRDGGAVVDFIDFRWWPVFNVADMSLFFGVLSLLWLSRRA